MEERRELEELGHIRGDGRIVVEVGVHRGGGTCAMKTGSFASIVSCSAWSEENIYVKNPRKIKAQLVIIG